jgi:putative ABC transport system permease protein
MITVVLIIGVFVIKNQLSFVVNKDLGFKKDNIISIPMANSILKSKYPLFKSELKSNPSILNVCAGMGSPFLGGMSTKIKDYVLQYKMVDQDYMPTMGINIIEGRNFVEGSSSDSSAYILNETAVKKLNIEKPVESEFTGIQGKKGMIIGIVKDFHNNSLYSPIDPVIFQIIPNRFSNIYVRIKTEKVSETITFLKQKWNEFVPDRPFEYTFLDEDYSKLYSSSQNSLELFICFSLIAVFVSCLGLLGLSTFMLEKRTKEIGIRKVLGAAQYKLLFLLSKEFGKWIITANLIAWPIAYYCMTLWLREFTYKVDINILWFISAGIITVILASFSIAFQTIKILKTNPVESLKYE